MKIHQLQESYFSSAVLPPLFPEENMCISSDMSWKYCSLLQCRQGNQTNLSCTFFFSPYKTTKFWLHHYQSQTNELLINITENMSRFVLVISIVVNATCHRFLDTEAYGHRATYSITCQLTGTGRLHANCTLGMFIHASHLLNCAHTQILERASCYRQKQHLKFVNILMRYMFSFQRLGNYFEYRHNHHIHPKNLNNFSGHKQAWYSFEVLTKLVFSIIGASMSPTKSKIHQHFSPLLCFRKMVPVGRRESPCRSMTYGSSVIGMNS